jgi:hypothetical protein
MVVTRVQTLDLVDDIPPTQTVICLPNNSHDLPPDWVYRYPNWRRLTKTIHSPR